MVDLKRVGECLYRSQEGVYYALLKINSKQIKRSLLTKDLAMAKRRLREFKNKAQGLVTDRKSIDFKTVAQRWLETQSHLKQTSLTRRQTTVKGLLQILGNEPIYKVGLHHIEKWKSKRATKISARSYNMELETLRLILDYARDQLRLILDHPAGRISKKKLITRHALIPSKKQFGSLLNAMRSDSSQNKGELAADLVEFLGYSGCRVGEATQVTWRDIDFDKDTLNITGGEAGTKNSQERLLPLFPPLKRFLLTLRTKRSDLMPDDRLFQLLSAKTCIGNSCKRVGLPHFTHHHFRHFFCSNCIEAGVDFKTIGAWLGHQDGGVLVAKTYGHLRAEHSAAMAKKVTFDAAT